MARILPVMVALLMITTVACGGESDEDERTATPNSPATPSPAATTPATPTVAGSPTATPSPTPSSASSIPSGIDLIDEILRAVEQRDAATLESRLHFFLAACTGGEGIGAIPCSAGQPPGSPVQVVLSGSCEGSFTLKGDPSASTLVRNFLATEPSFYAVALRPRGSRDEILPGDYLALFVKRAGPFAGGGVSLTIDEEGITAVGFGCGATPVEEMAGPAPEYLVPPR